MLHSFTRSDGAFPLAGLIEDSCGALYGIADGAARLGRAFTNSCREPAAREAPNLRAAALDAGTAAIRRASITKEMR